MIGNWDPIIIQDDARKWMVLIQRLQIGIFRWEGSHRDSKWRKYGSFTTYTGDYVWSQDAHQKLGPEH